MSKPVPPPFRPAYGEKIRAMRKNTDLFLAGAKSTSIKTIACRIGAELSREYMTRNESGGVRVWRIT